jgi:hypothetical protein
MSTHLSFRAWLLTKEKNLDSLTEDQQIRWCIPYDQYGTCWHSTKVKFYIFDVNIYNLNFAAPTIILLLFARIVS